MPSTWRSYVCEYECSRPTKQKQQEKRSLPSLAPKRQNGGLRKRGAIGFFQLNHAVSLTKCRLCRNFKVIALPKSALTAQAM